MKYYTDMKKLLFLAIASMLSLSIHAQQSVIRTAKGIAVQKSATAVHQERLTSRRALAENQYLCGLYNTDDLAEYGSGMGSYTSGVCKAATEFGPEVYKDYAGFKVVGMRVGLCADTPDFAVFISKEEKGGIVEFKNKSVGTGLKGWNTVMFDEADQFELPSDNTTFIVGYDYNQKSGTSSEACYPISYYEESAKKGIFLFYGNIPTGVGGSGLGWYGLGSDGALSVQLIVEGQLPDQHLLLGAGKVSKSFYQQGEQVEWTISATNMGEKEITSLGFELLLDDVKISDYTATTSIAASKSADVKALMTLPTDVAVGSHTLKAALTTINGKAPIADVENATQTATITTYKTAVQRQKFLIEHITSWTCTYCYLGYKLLRQMDQQYDDLAWVAIHGNQSTSTDPYYFSTVGSILNYLGGNIFPAAAFNRTYLAEMAEGEDDIVYGLGYNEQYISQLVPEIHNLMVKNATPAFVTLSIEQAYNPETRQLDVTVKGVGVEQAETLLSGNKLTIYLTEEGLTGRQYSSGRWTDNFEHNNTLRAVLTNYKGDDITWDGDNFEITKSYTIPSNFVAENLSITAFVSPVSNNKRDMAVNNCERVKVDVSSTGIENVNVATASEQKDFYTLDGRRVQNMQKGLNIVRMANGKTIKVVQK